MATVSHLYFWYVVWDGGHFEILKSCNAKASGGGKGVVSFGPSFKGLAEEKRGKKIVLTFV